ncbi:DUF3488 and transglutaminase-like domain-containing protein [Arthrobacter sp. B3I4]|uniref:transglutaminase family protein n=1 Tax=Arthrobacter sp. B3I4 TaxID=3042267 RepID=UPI0027844C24|nr:DUF3488 and transglutaminase-like domain-containing protein [Arthrobacter sp. B3I4]MDQ0757152.1 transglutaminase-like putative cysteine protease [Arthrobacter sp. B3I4]
MTLTPQRSAASGTASDGGERAVPDETGRRKPAGVEPWAMGLAVALAVAGAALGLNGVLRGWAWYPAVLTTVLTVALAMAALRALRLPGVLVAAGGFVALALVLTSTFFRQHSIAGFIPSDDTVAQLPRYLQRARETVLGESTPVAPNAGIVLLICGVLGLLVILIDTLCLPLALPATSGLGILAILVVPAMVKPQSVGWLGFTGAAVGYLSILACSHWFHPGSGLRADTARSPGQLKRAGLTGAMALALTLLLQLAIPGFDQGTFPQGSRLNPWGTTTGLNPMISLGNSLRSPSGNGRITYATNAPAAPYLRSVTVDSFDGDSWSPDDRDAGRRLGTGKMDPGPDAAVEEQVRVLTAVNTGQFTSPYLPVPYAPESVSGLAGRWSWDPATLSIKGVDANSRNQQYLVASIAPKLTPAVLAARPSGPVRGVSETFTRVPANVPQIVRQTADTVTAGTSTAYAKAMAIQKYLRSTEFSYSLQSPVQGGYDGNGLSVLADFLAQKSGYCIHFASAMAVMARLEGIPSRIAVGYAPGRPTGATVSVAGQGALPEYEVDARDAHAWPELYFQGVGWVAFEPTPSRGVVPAYAAEPAAPSGASTNESNDGLIPSDTGAATTAPAPVPLPLPAAQGGAGTGNLLVPLLLAAGGLLLLVLLVASPALARRRLRRQRLRAAAGPGGAVPAWAELQDLATDYGVPPRNSESPRHFAARLRRSPVFGDAGGADAPAHAAVAALTADFERERYGRPGSGYPAGVSPAGTSADGASGSAAAAAGTAAGADGADGVTASGAGPDGVMPDTVALDRIASVRGTLQAHAGWWARLRAGWLPPSLLARWRRGASAPLGALAVPAGRARNSAAATWSRFRGAVRRLRRG